ncbi:MAG: CoA transferase [Chloroflexi bacterium]|nr:CoA transferase [Chloroflexota bacterium]
MTVESGPPAALADVRVLDLADESGAYCGKLLADLGADVVKVEPPGGHPMRRYGPFLGDQPNPDRSLFFWHYNLNKRGITLNLESPDGQGLLRRLVGRADVLIETYPPGHLDSLGLGYGALRQVNPVLTVVSITPFGQTGPRKHWKGSDLVAQAVGGMMSVCGDPDREPVRVEGFQAFNVASSFAATGVLMALHWRAFSGEGQHLDVSLQEAVDSVLEVVNIFYIYGESNPGRQGTRHGLRGAGQVGDVYPCQDGYVCMLAPEPHQLRPLFQWMDQEGKAEDLLREPRYLVGGLRRDPNDERHMHRLISAFFSGKARQELFREGQRRGITLAAVAQAEELEENLQLRARGFFVEVEHPEMGRQFTYPGAPALYHGTPWRVRRRPPLVGEHNQEIYQGELGLTPQELTWLSGAGVI